jgi:hypothetical protein
MERDTTTLQAGTGDSPNPRSDDDDDGIIFMYAGVATTSSM